MDTLFVRIVTLSITAGIMILLIIPLRFLLKNGKRRLILLLWLIAGLRLVLPFTFTSPVSLIPKELSAPVNFPPKETAVSSELTPDTHPEQGIYPAEKSQEAVPDTPEDAAEENQNGAVFLEKTGRKNVSSLNHVSAAIWLLGMGGMFICMFVSAVSLYRDQKSAEHLSGNVYQIKRLRSAYVSGLIRPRIYLPASLTYEERDYVLAHERGHIHGMDPWLKWIACALLCVYWFNPLIWVGFVLFCHDLEYACDEYVTRNYDPFQRVRYTEILLKLTIRNSLPYVRALKFGEVNVRKRIGYILQGKRKSKLLNIGIILAAVGLAACTLSTQGTITINPAPSETEDKTGMETETGVSADTPDIPSDVYRVIFNGFSCISRYEKYQSGTNDIKVILENGEKRITLEDDVRLEKEKNGSWVDIPRTERYLKALEEAGRPASLNNGQHLIEPNQMVELFYLGRRRLEDEPLEEGNYRVKFTIDEEDYYFPFAVSPDGWDGKSAPRKS